MRLHPIPGMPAWATTDDNGDIHIDAPGILRAVGLPDTAENREAVWHEVREQFAALGWPAKQVIRTVGDPRRCDAV